jgi:hypothetical protein
VLLGLLYGVVRPGVLLLTAKVLDRPRRLALFVTALFSVPLLLVLV